LFGDSAAEAKTLLQKGLKIIPKESKFYPRMVRLNDSFNRKIVQRQSRSGIVSYFKTDGKYGFIKCDDGKEYFFHISAFTIFLSEEIILSLTNRRVIFDLSKDAPMPDSQLPKAVNITFEEENSAK
jgi:cold shock CspA family protein